MIKKLNTETFYSNSEKLANLREELNIKKNEIVKSLKDIGITTIGSSRTYARLENKELKFDHKTYVDLAKGLNLLFKKNKKIKKNITATDLYKKDLAEDKNSYTRLLCVKDAGELINLIHNSDRKKMFGLSEIESPAIPHIDQLFNVLTEVSKEEYKTFNIFNDEDLNNFQNEKRIIDISSQINMKLNEISNNFGPKLFAGILDVPLIQPHPINFKFGKKNVYELVAVNFKYLIYKFDKTSQDSFDVKYINPISLKKLKDLLNKYKVSREFDAGDSLDLIRSELNFELDGKMMDQNEYEYIPFSLDRDKIEFTPQWDYEEIPF